MKVKKTKGRKDQLDLVRLVHKTTRPSVCPGWRRLGHLALKLWSSQNKKDSSSYVLVGSIGLLKVHRRMSSPGAAQ